ncbi:DUF2399 domain-containing protein [Streptomyces sp. NBC_00882]|uniref:DUF2399 domain-containing protein n=1 Tax=Streptomyces sp. NBC_00882 TaxID=2975856 RepID=UPI003868F3B7|nr:DUF2399 domain-containing protein [Streptomyces sp. NBC_00882]WSZ36919.1 DUF2399 domain-containing protein [Streptomyces sp. NBC_00882]
MCDGTCRGADLDPLLTPELAWLWQALAAAADRRGDESLTSGPAVTVTVPAAPAQRAAAAGLIDGRPLEPGQSRRVNLEKLTAAMAARGPRLTPGAVAAHACGRRLAAKARHRAQQTTATDHLRTRLESSAASLPHHVRELIGPETVFTRLRTLGWVTRLLHAPDPTALLDQALQVAARLPPPGHRIDRRLLVPGNPHALDTGALPALVLALTGSSGTPARSAWARLGVDCDDLLGGLIITGITPRGWWIPPGAAVTLPPRELAHVEWEPPENTGTWIFVTENPSVLAAASNQALAQNSPVTPRVVCTAGTPSQLECEAIAALADTGWNIAVRADFDQAGLAHMRALLTAAPTAVAWRMSTADYLAAASEGTDPLHLMDEDAPWDTNLVPVMRKHSVPVYEEDLLPALLADITSGAPGSCTVDHRGA